MRERSHSVHAGSGPSLNSGYGLRTLAANTPAYNPLSYHRGSVWVHDTAIAVAGLARSGASREALASLVDGILAAAVVLLATTLAGVRSAVPNGRITIEPPLTPSPVGAFELRGLIVGDSTLDISLDADGRATAEWEGKPGPLSIVLIQDH